MNPKLTPLYSYQACKFSEINLHPEKTMHIFNKDRCRHDIINIDEQDIKNLELILKNVSHFNTSYNGSESLSKKYPEIWSALDTYRELDNYSYDSDIRVLMSVALIESLLIDPKSRKIKDQFSSKLILLNHSFFRNQIDFKEFFEIKDERMNECKVLEYLYVYRSKIAHSGKYRFSEEDEIRILKNRRKCIDILDYLLKEVLVVGLENPEMLMNLKRIK